MPGGAKQLMIAGSGGTLGGDLHPDGAGGLHRRRNPLEPLLHGAVRPLVAFRRGCGPCIDHAALLTQALTQR